MKQILFAFFFASALFAKDVQIVVEMDGDVASPTTVKKLVRDAVVQNGDSPVEESNNKLNVSLMPLGSSIIVVGELEKNGKAKNSTKLKAESGQTPTGSSRSQGIRRNRLFCSGTSWLARLYQTGGF